MEAALRWLLRAMGTGVWNGGRSRVRYGWSFQADEGWGEGLCFDSCDSALEILSVNEG